MGRRLVLQILLVAAILAVWYYISRKDTEEEGPPSPFSLIPPDSVSEISWIASDGSRRLERRGGSWIFHGGASRDIWRVDRGHDRFALEFLRGMERLRPQRILGEDAGGPEEFGLAPHAAALVVRAGTAQPDTLFVGDPTPVPGGRYVTWPRLKPRVAVFDGFVIEQFALARDDRLRAPNLARQPAGNVDTAAVTAGSRDFRLVRDGTDWTVEIAERFYRADSIVCEKAVKTLLRVTAILFLHREDDLPPPDLGLDPPLATWILDREGVRDTFRIGRRLLPERRMYIQTPERPPALALDDNWSLLVASPETYRSTDLFGGDPEAWTEIRLIAGSRPAGRLRRDGGRWRPLDGLVDPGVPDPGLFWSAAVGNLARMRYLGFRDPPAGSPDLLIVAERAGGGADTLRIHLLPEGPVAQGPLQRDVWGKIPPTEGAFWIRRSRDASSGGR